mmetsp:Transcript_80707/g.157715  ORF Transcript_80707/g.157715 Transcript_80707/m.157715 type:complete len:84 (-) Transcript_80707:27-278(-)
MHHPYEKESLSAHGNGGGGRGSRRSGDASRSSGVSGGNRRGALVRVHGGESDGRRRAGREGVQNCFSPKPIGRFHISLEMKEK